MFQQQHPLQIHREHDHSPWIPFPINVKPRLGFDVHLTEIRCIATPSLLKNQSPEKCKERCSISIATSTLSPDQCIEPLTHFPLDIFPHNFAYNLHLIVLPLNIKCHWCCCWKIGKIQRPPRSPRELWYGSWDSAKKVNQERIYQSKITHKRCFKGWVSSVGAKQTKDNIFPERWLKKMGALWSLLNPLGQLQAHQHVEVSLWNPSPRSSARSKLTPNWRSVWAPRPSRSSVTRPWMSSWDK